MENTSSSAIDQAAFLLGGRNALALKLGVSVTAIGNWKMRGVPWEHCVAIERATGGGVRRVDLRPDDYLQMWPELAQPQSPPAQPATEKIAEAIVEATAEIKQAVATLRQKSKPWDGKERRGEHRADASAGQGALI